MDEIDSFYTENEDKLGEGEVGEYFNYVAEDLDKLSYNLDNIKTALSEPTSVDESTQYVKTLTKIFG